MYLSYPQNGTVENGVCCMIGKSKEARKNPRHARRVTAKHDISAHTRQTWMAVE
jgi:hypothetical protein